MIDIHPVTPDRWQDLEQLAGPSGIYSGCWCMWWRVTSKEFDAEVGDGLRNRLRQLVNSGTPPGLLAYRGDQPIGWVSLGDRREFGRLNRSPRLKPFDDQPACSVVCFFIDREHRRSGVAATLLEAAVDRARTDGFGLIEGYPIDTSTRRRSSADLFTGTLDLFERAGFREVARRSGRPIVRRDI